MKFAAFYTTHAQSFSLFLALVFSPSQFYDHMRTHFAICVCVTIEGNPNPSTRKSNETSVKTTILNTFINNISWLRIKEHAFVHLLVCRSVHV